MKTALVILAIVVAVSGTPAPRSPNRIVGGSVTTINQYPFSTVVLYSANLINYYQWCGGALLNNRAVLTAAHCYWADVADRWRIRVGSSYANSGGTVFTLQQVIMHPQYDNYNYNNDIAILHSASNIAYSATVQPASIAGANYNLLDNQVVWAIGWGLVSQGGVASEQLRHVQIWTVNQNVCAQRNFPMLVNENMLCSGWLDVGGRDQCTGDSGSPLLHNNVVVGVCSWGIGCAQPNYAGVNTRVSRYVAWIQANA